MNYNNHWNQSRVQLSNQDQWSHSPHQEQYLLDLNSGRSMTDNSGCSGSSLQMRKQDSCLIDALKTSLISEEQTTTTTGGGNGAGGANNENNNAVGGIKSPGLLFQQNPFRGGDCQAIQYNLNNQQQPLLLPTSSFQQQQQASMTNFNNTLDSNSNIFNRSRQHASTQKYLSKSKPRLLSNNYCDNNNQSDEQSSDFSIYLAKGGKAQQQQQSDKMSQQSKNAVDSDPRNYHYKEDQKFVIKSGEKSKSKSHHHQQQKQQVSSFNQKNGSSHQQQQTLRQFITILDSSSVSGSNYEASHQANFNGNNKIANPASPFPYQGSLNDSRGSQSFQQLPQQQQFQQQQKLSGSGSSHQSTFQQNKISNQKENCQQIGQQPPKLNGNISINNESGSSAQTSAPGTTNFYNKIQQNKMLNNNDGSINGNNFGLRIFKAEQLDDDMLKKPNVKSNNNLIDIDQYNQMGPQGNAQKNQQQRRESVNFKYLVKSQKQSSQVSAQKLDNNNKNAIPTSSLPLHHHKSDQLQQQPSQSSLAMQQQYNSKTQVHSQVTSSKNQNSQKFTFINGFKNINDQQIANQNHRHLRHNNGGANNVKKNQTIDYDDDSTMRNFVNEANQKQGGVGLPQNHKNGEETMKNSHYIDVDGANEESKGLLDKIIDFTGQKFQRFGDLFRVESPTIGSNRISSGQINDSGLKTERVNCNQKTSNGGTVNAISTNLIKPPLHSDKRVPSQNGEPSQNSTLNNAGNSSSFTANMFQTGDFVNIQKDQSELQVTPFSDQKKQLTTITTTSRQLKDQSAFPAQSTYDSRGYHSKGSSNRLRSSPQKTLNIINRKNGASTKNNGSKNMQIKDNLFALIPEILNTTNANNQNGQQNIQAAITGISSRIQQNRSIQRKAEFINKEAYASNKNIGANNQIQQQQLAVNSIENKNDKIDLSNPQILLSKNNSSKIMLSPGPSNQNKSQGCCDNNPKQKQYTLGELLNGKLNQNQNFLAVPDMDDPMLNLSRRSSKSNNNNNLIPAARKAVKKNGSLSKSPRGLNLSANSNVTTAVPSPNPPNLLGMTPQEALNKYSDELTMFEKTELGQFDQIFTVGSYRRNTLQEVSDAEGYYRARIGEQIGYRYQVCDIVDKGAFGQVVKCFDVKEQYKEVALKISRNKKFDVDNAEVEYKILNTLKDKDPTDRHGVVRIMDSFHFRKHVVLVFELLGLNLYKHMKQEDFKPFSRDQLKNLTLQILTPLSFLKEVGVIHCDLKPENILFTDDKSNHLKVIDFGSSCFSYKTGFQYVQSRYYRAPEIVMGLPYNQAADMWSLGCIVAELKTKRPLFPAIDENELLEFFVMMFGLPSSDMIDKCRKKTKFFDKNNRIIRSKQSRLINTGQRSFPLRKVIDHDPVQDDEYMDFLEKCLEIDPDKRITPEQAMQHPWLKSTKQIFDLLHGGSQQPLSAHLSKLHNQDNHHINEPQIIKKTDQHLSANINKPTFLELDFSKLLGRGPSQI